LDLKRILSVVAKNRLLFFLGVAGLVLLLFTGITPEEKTAVNPLEAAESYRLSLEKDIAAACESVKGVGSVRVLLSLATTEIAGYEKNQSGDSQTLALSGGDGMLLCYRMPEIAGVSVVCTGGGSPTVKQELTSLLCKSLDIPSTAVHIAPLK